MSAVKELVSIILELNQKIQDQKYLIDSLEYQVMNLQNRVGLKENDDMQTVSENKIADFVLNEQQTW